MIKLEVNKTYSTKELQEALNITKDQWKRKKNQYLKSLSMAYDYEIKYQGNKISYTILSYKADYEAPPRKNERKKVDKTIRNFINQTIEDDPLQTAANINRIAWARPTEIALLGLKNSTTGEYIRLNLREMYGTVEQ